MSPFLGIGLKVLSALVFTIMSGGIKWLGAAFPTGEIVFFRSAFALIPLLIWLSWRGGLLSAVRTSDPMGHVVRGLIGSCGMFSGFVSLAYLPLSDSVAIGYVAPLMTVALSAIFLRETVRIYRWTAVGIGFLGVLVMLLPGLTSGATRSGIGVAFALLGAVCSAGATIQTRRLTQTERTGAIVLYFSLLTTTLGLSTAILGWTMPTPGQFALLVGIGILGGIGQILLTQSYRYADASLVAPFDYSTMIWAIPIGFVLFGQLPDLYLLVGGVIVAGAGLFVIYRERRLGLLRKRQVETGARGPIYTGGGDAMTAIALTIAGSDSGGGAGIQADLKAFSALGVYGASVITALTAQNTRGVQAIHDPPAEFVAAQIESIFSDLAVGAVKIGMLSRPATIEAVAAGLLRHGARNVVLDPVMIATSGDRLITPEAIETLRTKLLPLADLITPNLPEAAELLGEKVAEDESGMRDQAKRLLGFGPKAVLIKGGHGGGCESVDLMVSETGEERLVARRIETRHTHGTGCTLSAAIAAGLAKGLSLAQAAREAKTYLTQALEAGRALGIGGGSGPVHHFYALWPAR